MTDSDTPNTEPGKPVRRPVSAVRDQTAVVARELRALQDHYGLLEEALPTRPRPRTIDDATVRLARELYGQMAADYRDLYEVTGRRWQAEVLDEGTRAQVDGYVALVAQVRDQLARLLDRVDDLSVCTIDRRLAP